MPRSKSIATSKPARKSRRSLRIPLTHSGRLKCQLKLRNALEDAAQAASALGLGHEEALQMFDEIMVDLALDECRQDIDLAAAVLQLPSGVVSKRRWKGLVLIS